MCTNCFYIYYKLNTSTLNLKRSKASPKKLKKKINKLDFDNSSSAIFRNVPEKLNQLRTMQVNYTGKRILLEQ